MSRYTWPASEDFPYSQLVYLYIDVLFLCLRNLSHMDILKTKLALDFFLSGLLTLQFLFPFIIVTLIYLMFHCYMLPWNILIFVLVYMYTCTHVTIQELPLSINFAFQVVFNGLFLKIVPRGGFKETSLLVSISFSVQLLLCRPFLQVQSPN